MKKQVEVDLSVEFAGVKMRSPIGAASLSPFNPGSLSSDRTTELILKHVHEGAGFVHTHAIIPEHTHPKDKLPTGRFIKAETRGFGTEGFWCCADAHRIILRLDPGLRLVDRLTKETPEDVAVIANVMGPGADPDAWAELSAQVEAAGADLIELNVSCPLPAAVVGAVDDYCGEHIPAHAGVLLGDMPALLMPMVKAVVKRCGIPVGVKLAPETGFPRVIGLVEQLKTAGAAFVTSINAPVSVAPPDIYNGGKSPYPGLDVNPISPALGPWTRYLCYRNVGTISLFVPGIDQAAVGGLVDVRHVVESVMLGAKICELSSGALWKGWSLIRRMNAELVRYMVDQGYTSLDQFRGLGVQHLGPTDNLDWGVGRLAAKVDAGKCTGCGVCTHNLCWAMSLVDEVAECDELFCGACNLCVTVCPEGAIVLGPAENPRTEEEIWRLLSDPVDLA